MKEEQYKINSCPEFPFFGASYPDARCIDGYLWDLDKYEDGMLYGGGEEPCPFCNREEYVQNLRDCEISEKRIKAHLKFLDDTYL